MEIVTDFVHAVHYSATFLAFGSLVFFLFIAAPASRGLAISEAERHLLWRVARRLAAWSLLVAALSGALWFLGQVLDVSGMTPAEAMRPQILSMALEETEFGQVWQARAAIGIVLAILLAACPVEGTWRGRLAAWLSLAAVTAFVGAMAWSGHAVSEDGTDRTIHLASDTAHLLAAGAWLGALVPLTHLLGSASRPSQASLALAAAASKRFSIVGLTSVGTLIASGLVNSWYLVGNVAGLVGTDYGRLLMIKLGLFALMLCLAATNRYRLTPMLAAATAAGERTSLALYRLRRNVMLETGLGLFLLGVLSALATSPPGTHSQPTWPFPIDFAWDAARVDRTVAIEVWTALGVALAALMAAALAARLRRRRLAVPALAVFLGAMAVPSWLLAVPAYPTSYIHSPIRYEAASIARGEPIFAANCAKCHGAYGYGDGPAAAVLGIRPANLTGVHLYHHGEGTLFWWVTHGIDGTAMPAFGNVLSEDQRWDLLNFLRSQADAEQSNVMTTEVEPWGWVTAPNFVFEGEGSSGQATLKDLRGRAMVLLVLYTLPESLPRLRELAAADALLEHSGLTVMAAAQDGRDEGLAEADPALRGIGIHPGQGAVATYSLYRRTPSLEGVPPMPPHLEFLIDRAGYLRFRFNPADGGGWSNLAALRQLVDRLNKEPARPPAPEGHVHGG